MANKQVSTSLEDKYHIESDCSDEEFLSVSKIYARKIVEEYQLNITVSNINWEISQRAKRRAGAVHHCNGKPKKIQLTWEYFKKEGWCAIANTIRHELIHVHLLNSGHDPSHDEKFNQLAERLDTSVYCENFSEPNWIVTCQDCDQKILRYKKSKLVKKPNEYQCGECGGDFLVKSNN